MKRQVMLAATALVVGITGWPLSGAADEVDYLRDIKPLLREQCFSCHGALKQKADLRLDTADLIRKGGESGPALVSGNAGASLILERVSTPHEDERMPQEAPPLAEQQINQLRKWIAAGAPSPANEKPETDPREHWSFRPIERPAVPDLAADRAQNEIDHFVLAALRQRNLQASSPASAPTLLRRVYIDLVGVPPTREELHAFLDDDSPAAWEKVVERLLDDPRYGERWGRHWMDIWRYSDWYGRRSVPDVRNSYPGIWRWRDWIVRSLNEDKPYAQMIREMLAGDEIAPADDDTVAATGFVVRNWFALNSDQWRKDMVEHTGKAFLGLTFNCAHCHDHKYDPISQREYFAFRAFFEPIELRLDRVPAGGHVARYIPYVPGTTSLRKPGPDVMPRVFDDRFDAETRIYEGGDARAVIEDETPVSPGVPAIVAGDGVSVEAVELPAVAAYPGLKTFIRDEERQKRQQALDEALASGDEARIAATSTDLKALLARTQADDARYGNAPEDEVLQASRSAAGLERIANHLLAEVAVTDKQAAVAKAEAASAEIPADDAAKVKAAATALKKAQNELAAAKKTLASADKAREKTDAEYTPLTPVYHDHSSGRRTALADWIASADNPLTARVAVNHIWARHFRQPLATPVDDLGRRGKPPTHPQLIDWLAAEFIDSGWSMKHLHRLIVTSQVYRMKSGADESTAANADIDRDNRYLWRFHRDQAESEVIRDSILHASGRLDPAIGGAELKNKDADTSLRRTLYFETFPEDGGKGDMVALFDAPDPCDCYARSSTIVPQQALAIINNPLVLSSSRVLARDLAAEFADENDFVTAAFEQILTRSPTADELNACRGFLVKQRALYGSAAATAPLPSFDASDSKIPPSTDPELRSRETLVQTLFAHSEFVTLQ